MLANVPGYINVSFEGVTVNSKHKILYTVSKGEHSMFFTWSALGSNVHVTDAEVTDALKVCAAAKEMFNAKIASLPVDNAAVCVATKVADALVENAIVSRDPAHCVDLLSKDLANTKVVGGVLKEAKEVYSLVKRDRIDSIRSDSIAEGRTDYAIAAKHHAKTRMNFVHEHVRSAAEQ